MMALYNIRSEHRKAQMLPYFLVRIPPSAGPAAPTTQVMVKLTLSAMFLCLLVKQAIMATHTEQPFVPSANPQITKYTTK